MILADKILNLRKKNGWSQEDLAEKLNVSRQSISKWEGAIAIPDINKIIDMAKLFGVTTDYLLKDDINDTIYSDDEDDTVKKVSLQEVNGFIKDNIKYGNQTALGVFLCIISPTILILLAAVSEFNQTISEELGVVLGLVFLFLAISIAISIFIIGSANMKKYESLQNDKFELEYGVASIVKEKKNNFLNKYNIGLTLSIVAIILGVLPLIITGILECSDLVVISMIDVLLLVVASSVYIIIRISMRKASYDLLLSEDDYDYKKRIENKYDDRFSGFYWPIVTAGYLCWSFISNDWNITWIVWPIAGLLYAGIKALFYKDDAKK